MNQNPNMDCVLSPKRTPSLHAQRSQVHPLIWNVHAELIFRTQTRYDGLDSIRNREIDAVLLNEECLGPYSSVIHARLFVASNVGGERVGSKRDCDNEKKLNRCVKIKKMKWGMAGHTHGSVFAREAGPEHVRQGEFDPLSDVKVQDVSLAPELVDHLRIDEMIHRTTYLRNFPSSSRFEQYMQPPPGTMHVRTTREKIHHTFDVPSSSMTARRTEDESPRGCYERKESRGIANRNENKKKTLTKKRNLTSTMYLSSFCPSLPRFQ